LALFLALAAPALAQTGAPVEWSIGFQGDVMYIDAKTSAGPPSQKASSSPAYLEVAFPKSKLASAALSKAIDKGLVRRVQTAQDGDSAVLRVYVLSKPKASLTKTAQGYRYSIRMSEPAGSPAASRPPARPATPAATPPVAASQPRVVSAPVASQPATAQPPAARPPVAQPPAARPPAQAPAAHPPAATPPAAQPPVAAHPPAAPPAAGRNPRTPVTILFKDKPLADAVVELASKAGYTAQVDPKVNGVVNLSLSEVPFEDALALLLEPYGKAVTSDIGYSTVTVTMNAAAAPSSPQADLTSPSSNGPIVFEYYPFKTKDAQKMMDAARKAIPELSYRVDPVLNILLVQGPRADVVRLGELLKSMSEK
jgi:hypothetical protein